MRALSRFEYWGILAIGIAVFLAVDAVFSNPFAIDASILWSYLVVFLLVPIALASRRALTLRNLFFYELELILLKYGVTTCIAVALWATNDPPEHERPRPEPIVSRQPVLPPTATLIPEEATGAIEGLVLDPDGGPVADALVYVDSGLDDLAFTVPADPVVIENTGNGFTPSLTVLRAHQQLRLVVRDRQLHTLAGTNERGEQVFSVPMVASGRAAPFSTTREFGLVRLSCRVHDDEPRSAHLVVLSHPFSVRSTVDGRFSITSVPARLVTLRAVTSSKSARGAVTVTPRGIAKLDMNLAQAILR